MNKENDIRIVNLLLGSFKVHIPVEERIDPRYIFLSRDIVNEVFESATFEIIKKRTLFEQPIRPHTLVSNIRHGSIEFDILYRIIAGIPWSHVVENTEWAIKHGMNILETIGSVAGGIYVLKDIGKWIKERLKNKEVPLNKQDVKEVSIELTSKIEIDIHVLDTSERIDNIHKRLYADKNPFSYATIITGEENISRLFRIGSSSENNINQHLGGEVIVNDLNMHINGIKNIEQLGIGDLLILNNHSALGIQLDSNPASVYNATYGSNPELEIQFMQLNTYETHDEKRIYRGRILDSDELPDEG